MFPMRSLLKTESFFFGGGGGGGKGCIVTSCLVGLLNQATNPKPAH